MKGKDEKFSHNIFFLISLLNEPLTQGCTFLKGYIILGICKSVNFESMWRELHLEKHH